MIRFHATNNFKVSKKKKLKNSLKNIVLNEKKKVGDINFIFCWKDELREMNRSFLKRDYDTDVITFEYSQGSKISGDIFVSNEVVKRNSVKFNVKFDNELKRVMIHGILHLLNYDDKKEDERDIMKKKEDYYLNILEQKTIYYEDKIYCYCYWRWARWMRSS